MRDAKISTRSLSSGKASYVSPNFRKNADDASLAAKPLSCAVFAVKVCVYCCLAEVTVQGQVAYPDCPQFEK